jgi:hypothetical protein
MTRSAVEGVVVDDGGLYDFASKQEGTGISVYCLAT